MKLSLISPATPPARKADVQPARFGALPTLDIIEKTLLPGMSSLYRLPFYIKNMKERASGAPFKQPKTPLSHPCAPAHPDTPNLSAAV